MKDASSQQTPDQGIFLIDVKNLKLSTAQLETLNKAIQETVQRELAKLNDTEGPIGGPLGGRLMGYMAE